MGLGASSLGFRPLGVAFRDALPFKPVFVFAFGARLWRSISVLRVWCWVRVVSLSQSNLGQDSALVSAFQGLGSRVHASGI